MIPLNINPKTFWNMVRKWHDCPGFWIRGHIAGVKYVPLNCFFLWGISMQSLKNKNREWILINNIALKVLISNGCFDAYEVKVNKDLSIPEIFSMAY